MTFIIHDYNRSKETLPTIAAGTVVVRENTTTVVPALAKAVLANPLVQSSKKSFLSRIIKKVTGSKKAAITGKENKEPAKPIPATNTRFQKLPIKIKRLYRDEQKIPEAFVPPGQKIYNTPEFLPVKERSKTGKHVFIDAEVYPIGDYPIVAKKVANPNKKPKTPVVAEVAAAPKASLERVEIAENQTGTVVYKVTTDVKDIRATEVEQPVVQEELQELKAQELLLVPKQKTAPVLPIKVKASRIATTKSIPVVPANSQKTPEIRAVADQQGIALQSVKKNLFRRICDRVWGVVSFFFKTIANAIAKVVNWPFLIFKKDKTKPAVSKQLLT